MREAWKIGTAGQFAEFRRYAIQRLENASLQATDRAARAAHGRIASALPGKLGKALGYGSDLRKGRGVHRLPGGGYRASGWVFIRGGSERAVGAIESATEGAEIVPVRSPWLWIATDQIPKRVGKFKMTPQRYRQAGLDKSIGPLIEVPGRHRGESLLVVYGATIDKFGRPGRARAVPRSGRIAANRIKVTRIVAFVGIRRTSRTAVVNARAILDEERRNLRRYREEAMARDGYGR